MAERPYKPKRIKTGSRAGKVTNKPTASVGTYSAIVWSVSIGKSHHFSNSRTEKKLRKTEGFMRTGFTKREKTTTIYFDEYGSMIDGQTHNTNLKKRLTAFAANYPECCRQIDDDEQGGLIFEIEKGRLSFHLTAPYSEERKRAASKWAKKNSNIKNGRQA